MQVPSAQQATKETVVSYLCVSIVFLITGCTLPTRVLIENYARWRVHLFVALQCFLVTSATIFAVVTACATNKDFMDPALLVGLIIWSCLPTTISSNVVMTRQAHGNQALTVVETTIGNFLAPFISPVLVQMYLSWHPWYTTFLPSHSSTSYTEIYRRVFKQLGLSIYLPMAIGQVLQHFFPTAMKILFGTWKLNKIASLALLTIVWSTFDQAFETGAFSSVKPSNNIFIVFMSIAFFLLWLGITFPLSFLWLPRKDTIAMCYCVPAKSIAIGVPLASVLFVGLSRREQSKLQIPMIIFQGLQIPAGSLMTVPFRRWVLPEEEAEEKKAEGEETAGSELMLQRVQRSRSREEGDEITRIVSFP